MVRKFTNIQEKEICKQYFSEEKLSTVVLAKMWKCASSTIGDVLERQGHRARGLKGLKRSEDIKRKFSDIKKTFTKEQEQQICNEYFSKRKPSADVLAEEWNCSRSVIRNVIIRNGFSLRSLKGLMSDVQKMFTKKEEQQICNEYFSKKKLSIIILAKKWNCTRATIRNVIIRNGYTLRTFKETKNTFKAIQQALKNGFGINCYYDNEFFPSLQEKNCYIKLKKLCFKVKHNFEGRFDFLINNKVVVEFHPFDFKLTDKQYYVQRRKLLDEYGHKDLKLIVIKNLNDANKNIILI